MTRRLFFLTPAVPIAAKAVPKPERLVTRTMAENDPELRAKLHAPWVKWSAPSEDIQLLESREYPFRVERINGPDGWVKHRLSGWVSSK